MRGTILTVLLLGLSTLPAVKADLIRVPYDYETITEACEVAQSGDTVGVHPGQYYEDAHINPGVTVLGITPDSTWVWVEASNPSGPFRLPPGDEPAVIENMTIWAGLNYAVGNDNPNLLIQRCRLIAFDANGTGGVRYLVGSSADFVIRNCFISYLTQVGNLFLLSLPADVLMEDCVIYGIPFDKWVVTPGSRFEFRNITIDGPFIIDLDWGPPSTELSIIVVNSIMDYAVCDEIPDTLEWRYNDFYYPGGMPNCGYQEGNFEGNPLWCDPWPSDAMDYRLQPESPCIGAGENGEDVGARIGICWDPASAPGAPGALGSFRVSEPWPNPTRDGVTLSLGTDSCRGVTMEVLDVAGRVLRTLSGNQLFRGGLISWDGRLRGGKEAPGGVYYLRLRGGPEDVTRKVIVAR